MLKGWKIFLVNLVGALMIGVNLVAPDAGVSGDEATTAVSKLWDAVEGVYLAALPVLNIVLRVWFSGGPAFGGK